ncbi:Heparinase II/III-like protein [Cyclobacterium xiamenense]|uniref:Heparinase II/III-like protein n=1 Tax=Cyclobacterium xiamenense TaxID=1297121 RepID=A0A1H7BVI0_9BACT|nr:heparinase II/III family protein [Cyclobacterium xiamenense]SEJ81226.1 Heparinase II/III-like protein [Cyclobacterium xiamenense]
MNRSRWWLVPMLVCLCGTLPAQQKQRPFIWVRAQDRMAILEKVEKQSWANEIYTEFIGQLDKTIQIHESDPVQFLGELPFDWEKGTGDQIPPFHRTYHIEDGIHKNLDNATEAEMAHARTLIRYLQVAVDCGIAYYLTEEEKYAQCAADILYVFVTAVRQSPVSEWRGRGGWLFPDDGFREVREIGYKVPLVYDFIADYLKDGGKPFDPVKNSKTEFPVAAAQEVFRTYAALSIHYGQTGSNHPILEAPNLVYNALAMENEQERDRLLAYFLTENTENQDALSEMAKMYKKKGDLWPETSQYLNAAASILTRLMLVVNRYDPTNRLGQRYAPILYSLPALDYLVYPNGQLIRWGDGKRTGTPPYSSYEEAYLLGAMDGSEEITREFASLLVSAMQEGAYHRSGILAVLWYAQEYSGEGEELVLPRTDKVDHAGIFLQRNESDTGNPEDGLMAFVGGAHMVHGHAEGMNIELYGRGEVLGVDNGRGRYQQDIHENYSRLFAAHNTVIVNGNSRSEGGWVNLGINTVTQIAMEPQPWEKALSPDHSFSITRFVDDKGELAKAVQERTLAVIRTSDTSGYYVDVFRSRSELPEQYHDYLYHNIGDSLVFLNDELTLIPTPDRYTANAALPWIQNRQYRHPGWHFFDAVQTAENYQKGVRARFVAEKFDQPIYMDLHIPPQDGRSYTKVLAPPTFEAPDPYENQATPTLLIRQQGEAWHQPFALVFEPFGGPAATPSLQSVEKLTQDGAFAGFFIRSRVAAQERLQYVLIPMPGKGYRDKGQGISFTGSFAVITTDSDGMLQSIYIGEGEELRYGAQVIRPAFGKKSVYRRY